MICWPNLLCFVLNVKALSLKYFWTNMITQKLQR